MADLMEMLDRKLKQSEEQLKAHCQLPAFTLALLTLLRDKGIATEADIQKVHDLTETGTEMLFSFFTGCMEAAEFSELDEEDESKAREIAKKIHTAAKWLLAQPVNPKMREEFEQAIKMGEFDELAKEL